MSQALHASAIAQYQNVLTQLSESLEAHKAPTSLDEPFDELFEARMAKLEVTSAMAHLKRLHELVDKREKKEWESPLSKPRIEAACKELREIAEERESKREAAQLNAVAREGA